MTRYHTFLDSSTSEGIETIQGVLQNGSTFGVGISSVIQIDNLITLNSIGIGTTIPNSKLQVIGNVNISGIVTANSFTGNLVGIASSSIISGYATTSGISTLTQGITGVPNVIIGITTIGLTNSTSPVSNSQMSFELTDNTTLTVRVKGTDGIVRTGIVSLT